MSRRQALGVISNVASANSLNQLKPSNINKTNVLGNLKNENEPPPWSTKHQKMTNDSDFEIFQEDLSENKKPERGNLREYQQQETCRSTKQR